MSSTQRTYIETLMSRRLWIAAVTLLAGLVAGIYSLTLDDQYRACARLLVLEPSVESKAGGYYNVTTTVYTVDTYSSMLGNQEMLAGIVRDMGLDFPPDRLTPHKLRGRLSVIPVKDTKLIEIAVVYSNPVKAKVIVNKVAERFVELYRNLRTTEIESSQAFVRQQLDRAERDYGAAQDSLRAARAGGKVDQLQLRLQHLLEELKMFETDLEATRTDRARSEAHLAELTTLLADLPEQSVAATREARSTVSGASPADSHAIVTEARRLLGAVDVAAWGQNAGTTVQQGSIDQAGARVARMRAALDELQNPPGRRRLTPQEWGERYRLVADGLEDLAKLLDRLAASAGEQGPVSGSVTRQLHDLAASARGELAQQTREEQRVANPLRAALLREQADMQVAVRGYLAKETQLATVVANLKGEIRSVEDRLYRGMRDVEAMEEATKVAANLRNMLSEKHDQSRIEVAAKLGTMTLVDPALIPEKRIGPPRKLNVVLGMLLGFSFASALALGREYLQGYGRLSSAG